MDCSKGTYVRSLADEIGKRLGTVGYLDDLCRTSCGDFSLEESMTLEKLAENPSLALEQGAERLESWLDRLFQRFPSYLQTLAKGGRSDSYQKRIPRDVH